MRPLQQVNAARHDCKHEQKQAEARGAALGRQKWPAVLISSKTLLTSIFSRSQEAQRGTIRMSDQCTKRLAKARAAAKSAKLRLGYSGRYLAVRIAGLKGSITAIAEA